MEPFRPPRGALPYAPTQKVTLAASAGSTGTMTFRGLGGEEFGVVALVIDATSLTGALATITRDKGRKTDCALIHLSALRQLFAQRQLLAPLVIAKNNVLQIELINHSGAENTVRVQLIGFTAEALAAWRAWSQQAYGRIVEPMFVHAYKELEATQSNAQTPLDIGADAADVYAFSIGSTGLDDITLSLNAGRRKTLIDSDVTGDMLNDRYLSRRLDPPIRVNPDDPLTAYLTNGSGASSRTVSIIGEAYKAP